MAPVSCMSRGRVKLISNVFNTTAQSPRPSNHTLCIRDTMTHQLASTDSIYQALTASVRDWVEFNGAFTQIWRYIAPYNHISQSSKYIQSSAHESVDVDMKAKVRLCSVDLASVCTFFLNPKNKLLLFLSPTSFRFSDHFRVPLFYHNTLTLLCAFVTLNKKITYILTYKGFYKGQPVPRH